MSKGRRDFGRWRAKQQAAKKARGRKADAKRAERKPTTIEEAVNRAFDVPY